MSLHLINHIFNNTNVLVLSKMLIFFQQCVIILRSHELRGLLNQRQLDCLTRSMFQNHRKHRSPRSWWLHQMETFSALLAICAGNWPVPGEFPTQRPVTRSFDVFFDLHLNKRMSKQWWGWWFETLSRPLWRHRNVLDVFVRSPFVAMDSPH